VDIKTFKSIAGRLPANIAILMRGPTGVGKSFLAKALAEELNMPFIDVRGSTMDEAQVSGIPDFETSKVSGVATFCLGSWYVRACREACVLMLDELNRSMPQVMQSFFQVILDRELSNNVDGEPMRLHPGTRVIAAVNHGNEYEVNDMDPALLRRFWVVDLTPSHDGWIDWANESGLDSVLIDFVRQHPEHWRVDPGSVESGTVIPTPASWHRLSDSLVHMGWAPADIAGTKPEGFYPACTGFVGMEASIAFTEFVKRYERVISAEDVLSGKVDKAKAKGLTASESLAVIDKVVNWSKDNKFNKPKAKHVAAFIESRGGEQLVYFWNSLTKTQNLPNIQALHALIGQKVVELVRAARSS
jgi:hypothetical protein